jgi:hypothetical protein
MASTDATPIPIYAQAFRMYFALRLNTGGLNSGAAGLDSEISKDGGTFVDCVHEATEIAASSGVYYLDLTLAEMTANCVSIIVKSSTAGAVTKEFFLYPTLGGDIPVDVNSIYGNRNAANNQRKLLIYASFPLTVDDSTYAPTTTDFESSDNASRADDYFKGRAIIFTSGITVIGQAARCTGSTFTANGKMKFSVTALTQPPPNGTEFFVI